MVHEKYTVNSSTSFDIDIAPAAKDGKKHPIVLLIHGNFGLGKPFGDQLLSFTDQIASLGYLAALPSYYPAGASNPLDGDVDSHVPAVNAAVAHLLNRADADASRIGLVGFSLGGGIAMSYINSLPAGSVQVFVDFYGYVQTKLADGVGKFPPTIIFHNTHDELVRPVLNSESLADALSAAGIVHEPVAPYVWFDDKWDIGKNHVFKPGGDADTHSRNKTLAWLMKYLPPDGRT